MKFKPLIVSVVMFLLSGCSVHVSQHFYNQDTTNLFIAKSKRPIIVRSTAKQYRGSEKDITLISDDGKVLFIEYTTLILPDTIK